MKEVRCLTRADFRIDFEAWTQVAETNGYETITDMLWCMWLEDPEAKLYTMADELGWSVNAIRRLLQAMGIFDLVDSSHRAMLWRHQDKALRAGYRSMALWIKYLRVRGYTDYMICHITQLGRPIYRKYYGGA